MKIIKSRSYNGQIMKYERLRTTHKYTKQHYANTADLAVLAYAHSQVRLLTKRAEGTNFFLKQKAYFYGTRSLPPPAILTGFKY